MQESRRRAEKHDEKNPQNKMIKINSNNSYLHVSTWTNLKSKMLKERGKVQKYI